MGGLGRGEGDGGDSGADEPAVEGGGGVVAAVRAATVKAVTARAVRVRQRSLGEYDV